MSEKLTAFERALLQQFEALAAVSESALSNSEDVSEKLRELGNNMKVTFDQLARRQSALEQRQKKLTEALDVQTKLTEDWKAQSERLVQQVNALLTERKR
jgi:predicted nuclease with TOPRIM domain